ncbi:MAG TPA: signal peptide peptidase SppA [Longimicrobiales bacterium]|nr:signal peptide peptidase SppA [Longimicrobiales bacterium]
MNRRSLLLVIFGGVFLLVTVAGIALAVLSVGRGASLGLGGRVALVEIDGLLLDDEELLEQLRWLRQDPTVRGFVVAINSPGGVVAPSQSIYRTLREIRDEDRLPVIASIGSVGASGGYYVALGADSIYVLPGSITGSIGVIMEFPNASELLDRIGFHMETVQSSEHKDIGSPFRDMTEEDRALLASLVDDVYGQFVDAVAAERDMPRERVLEMADGRLFSGRQAVGNGLADAEGNIDDAIAAVGRMADLGEDPYVIRPPKPRLGLLGLLLGGRAGVLARLVGAREPIVGPSIKYVPAF